MRDPSAPARLRPAWAALAGELLLGSLIASAAWASFVAVRPGHGAGAVPTWLATTGLALPAFTLLVALIRAAGASLEAVQPEPESRRVTLSVLALTGLLCAAGLRVFASVLYSTTHHRGLGGATFGILGAVAVLGAWLVVWRLSSLVRKPLSRPVVAWVIVGVSAACVLLLTRGALRGTPEAAASPVAVGAWDALLGLTLAGFASRLRIARPWDRLATPAAAGLFAVVVSVAMFVAPGVASAGPSAQAPWLRAALRILGRSAPDTTPAASASASGSAVAPSGSARTRPSETDDDPASAPRPKGKPDIVLVSLDSVRADHSSSYAYARSTTPKLDALAAQAAVFERAFAAGPETRTAIAPLLTGTWLEHVAHDERPWPTILDTEDTLAERLQKAGYATGAVSSFQWISKERGFAQGMDVFDESPFRKVHVEKWASSAHAVAQAIRAYDELAGKDRPVFLWVHLFDAHQKYLEHAGHDFGATPMDRYDGEIAFQDAQLGRLIEHVQKAGRAEKTVWIVHGTHGEGFGEHDLQGHPPAGFDEIVRVPMIVRLPWAAPRRVPDTVGTVDIVPTVLDLAGVKDTGLPGQTMVELADGSPPSGEAVSGVLVSYAGIPGAKEQMRAWIMAPLKLVVTTKGGVKQVALFDFARDPAEKEDLASSRTEDVKRLEEAMDAFIARAAAARH